MTEHHYPNFQAAEDYDGLDFPAAADTSDGDDNDWATDSLDRINVILNSGTPYAQMLAQICSVVDEWKTGR